MGPGEDHSYRFRLVSGQYQRVLLEQRGVDVALTLFDPQGNKISDFDGFDAGFESVSMKAESAGTYRLVVRPAGRGGRSGEYSLRLQAMSTPDRTETLMEAERLSTESKRLLEAGTAGSLSRAVQASRQALVLWRESGEESFQLATLVKIGECYYGLNQNQEALASFEEALPLAGQLGERRRRGELLNNIGILAWRLGRPDEALDHLLRALEVWRALELPYETAATLSNLGLDYWHVGEWRRAQESYNQALAAIRQTGDQKGEAVILNNIGLLYFSLGENEKAILRLNQALRLFQTTGPDLSTAQTLSTLGRVYLESGEVERAGELLRRALAIFQAQGEARSEAEALNFLGWAEREGDRPEKALQHCRRALEQFRDIGDIRGEAAALHNIGVIRHRMGERGEAARALAAALRIRRQIGLRNLAATTLFQLASVARDQGQLARARSHIEEALRMVESLRSRVVGSDLRASYLASRVDYYKFEVDILMRLHKQHPGQRFDRAAFKTAEGARARSLLELLAEIRSDIGKAFPVDPELLRRERHGQRLLNLASVKLERNRDPEKEGLLKRKLESALEAYQQVEIRIREATPPSAQLTQIEPLGIEEVQKQILDDQTLLLEYSLGEEASYLWLVTLREVTGFPLPPRAEIEAAARRVYQLARIRPSQQTGGSGQEYRQAAQALSRVVLAPVASRLGMKRLLIVPDGALQYVPFAALPQPSPAADGNHWLGDRHEIITMPSVSTLGLLRQQLAGRQPATGTIAILADPVFDRGDPRVALLSSGALSASLKKAAHRAATPRAGRALGEGPVAEAAFSRLPFSRLEAEAIWRVVPHQSSMRALDFEASKKTITSPELSRYRILHIATHGVVNETHPELSALVFSLVDRSGRSRDGFLRLHEIYNLKLSSDLVVLSACESGLGRNVRGEGLVGLTRGFMYAGAGRIVVSLWKVDDEATAELMKDFYQGIFSRRLSPAQALGAAQEAVRGRRRWRAPYYWAGFVFQGEWRSEGL